MPDNDRDHHERDPHFDGRYEGMINADIGGEKMGIRSDVNTENMVQPKNPFHLKPKEDREMKKFQDLFDGK
ncbi:hypothetical protein V7138_17870 [Bacillus sp. JJ1533]|uniref:hypothetical protein n=1 Tax=Bacillus sp. JJ1533 TaxID=3122959 RepID=UPI0030006F7C